MKRLPSLPRQARWAAPAAVVLTAGGLLAGSALPSAAAAPRLPARSAGQLLAALTTGTGLTGDTGGPALSGTITETASLGLPALPAELTGGGPSLLAGSHTVQVWYAGPDHFRLALPQSMSEDDLVRNGASMWLWDSAANTVTRVTLPASTPALGAVPAVPLTPQQAARQALAETGPATIVRVDPSVTVAGQAAYQLVLAPRSSRSLIGQVRIAIGSQHRVPLRVQVFARGAASPAAQVGFTAVSFGRPPAADYAFTPPAGARVIQRRTGTAAQASPGAPGLAADGLTSDVRVIGSGWLTVASLPESALAELSGSAGGGDLLPFRHSASSQAPGSAAPGRHGPGGQAPAGSLLGELLNSAPRVSGSWGSGRLIRTSLLSVLVTSTGRVLIGAVTPGVLYQAATQNGRPMSLGQHTSSRARPK
jgi:outer membrane lipoprotein-sorting protein